MAPEQLRGLQTDARTDIFAFGTVMYELFTGWAAFRGDGEMSTSEAILGKTRPCSTVDRIFAV